MTTKTKKVLGMILASALSQPLMASEHDARIKSVYSAKGDSSEIKSTVAVAPEGTYSTSTVPTRGQFFEQFRLYDVWKNNADVAHYIAAGIRLPKFNSGNVQNNVLLFGSTGDINGTPNETKQSLDKFVLNINT